MHSVSENRIALSASFLPPCISRRMGLIFGAATKSLTSTPRRVRGVFLRTRSYRRSLFFLAVNDFSFAVANVEPLVDRFPGIAKRFSESVFVAGYFRDEGIALGFDWVFLLEP